MIPLVMDVPKALPPMSSRKKEKDVVNFDIVIVELSKCS